MAFSRPTDYPRWTGIVTSGAWVDNDLANGPTGGNNAIEPSDAKKDSGWNFEEFPPRNWFNWLLRKISNWIYWLDQQEQDHESRVTSLENNINTKYNEATLRSGNEFFENSMAVNVNAIEGLTLIRASTTNLTVSAGGCGIAPQTLLGGNLFYNHFANNSVTQTVAAWLTTSASLTASTWHYFFAYNDGVGGNSIIADTDSLGANILIDHPTYNIRYIGAILTDGSSNIIDFVQYGDMFLFKSFNNDLTNDNTTGEQAIALTLPSGYNVEALVNIRYEIDNASGTCDYWDGILGSGNGSHQLLSQAASNDIIIDARLVTNTSRQIYINNNNASNYVSIQTRGWIDRRGRI